MGGGGGSSSGETNFCPLPFQYLIILVGRQTKSQKATRDSVRLTQLHIIKEKFRQSLNSFIKVRRFNTTLVLVHFLFYITV